MRLRANRRSMVGISALSGALGVLSGYTLFLCYREVHSEPSRERQFLIAVFLTAVVSYILEWLRELIPEGKIEDPGKVVRKTLVTFVVVLSSEVFLAGFHGSAEAMSVGLLRETAVALIGPAISEGSAANEILAVMAVGWVGVGAAVAIWLSGSVTASTQPMGRQIKTACVHGLIGGLIIAPMFVGGFVVVARMLATLEHVAADYAGTSVSFDLHFVSGAARSEPAKEPGADKYKNVERLFPGKGAPTREGMLIQLPPRVQDFLNQASGLGGEAFAVFRFLGFFAAWAGKGLILAVLYLPFLLLVLARKAGLWCFWLAFAVELGFLVWFGVLARDEDTERNRWLERLWWGVVLSTIGALCYGLFQAVHPLPALLGALVVAAILWGIPGLLLGILVPLLRRGAAHPRLWAFIGYGAALLLVLATLLLWYEAHAHVPWPARVLLMAAFAAGFAGLLFDRGIAVHDYWPVAALCVAFGLCGATSIVQHWTLAAEVTFLDRIIDAGSVGKPSMAASMPMHDEEGGYDPLAAGQLQIAIAGSVGFWMTVGLLACWSIEEHGSEEEPGAEAGESA